MKLLFHLFNHTPAGKRSLEDVIRIVIMQLRALGHEALWDPTNEPPHVKDHEIHFAHGPGEFNVIVEGFTPSMIEYIAAVKADNPARRFICLATEEPTDRGFNHGTQREMIARQADFPAAMRYFDGILHLVPGERVTRWYAQWAPTAQVELGYAQTLLRRQRVTNPRFDFGFYGSGTERRARLLRKLFDFCGRPPNCVRIVTDFCDEDARDTAMQDCKVILQVRKFEEMGLVSSSRCNTALCMGRPVVAEPHDASLSKPWDEIVKFTKTEAEFLLTCRMARNNWRAMHREQLRALATKLTPEVCIGRPLASLRLDEPRSLVA